MQKIFSLKVALSESSHQFYKGYFTRHVANIETNLTMYNK